MEETFDVAVVGNHMCTDRHGTGTLPVPVSQVGEHKWIGLELRVSYLQNDIVGIAAEGLDVLLYPTHGFSLYQRIKEPFIKASSVDNQLKLTVM